MGNSLRVIIGTVGMSLAIGAVPSALIGQTSSESSPQQTIKISSASHYDANVNRRLDRLTHELNLSEAQKQKIRPLLIHEVERINEVRSNTSFSQGESQRRIQGIHRDTEGRIRGVLTPEQKQQWGQDREQKRTEKMKQMHQHPALS